MSLIKVDHKIYLSFLEATAKRETYAVASFIIFTKMLNTHTCIHTHTHIQHTYLIIQKHLEKNNFLSVFTKKPQ